MLFEGWCGCSYPDLLKPQSDHVFVISFQTFKPQFISWVSTTDLSLFHMLLLLKVWIFSEMLNRVKCNLTELTTRSKLHSWHSVAQRCFALAWWQRQGLLVVPAAFVAWGWICPGVLSQGVFGQFQQSAAPLHIRRAPAHVFMALLGSAFGVVAFMYFRVFPLPPLPIQGRRGFSSIGFPLNSLFSVTGACFGVSGGGLVAGLRVGQVYGVFHRPGFRLLVSVPWSLSTQPPFATQVLIEYLTFDTS